MFPAFPYISKEAVGITALLECHDNVYNEML